MRKWGSTDSIFRQKDEVGRFCTRSEQGGETKLCMELYMEVLDGDRVLPFLHIRSIWK